MFSPYQAENKVRYLGFYPKILFVFDGNVTGLRRPSIYITLLLMHSNLIKNTKQTTSPKHLLHFNVTQFLSVFLCAVKVKQPQATKKLLR